VGRKLGGRGGGGEFLQEDQYLLGGGSHPLALPGWQKITVAGRPRETEFDVYGDPEKDRGSPPVVFRIALCSLTS